MSHFPDAERYLNNESEWIRARLYDRIVTEIDQGRGMFPVGATQVSHELIDALTYIFRTSSATATATLTPDASQRLRAWALDLRRVGFPPATYQTFAAIINNVLGLDATAAELIDFVGQEMGAAAHTADLRGIAPATAARITSITAEDTCSRVRLEASTPVSYQPGQYMPVMQVGRQGVWRNLAPALPANPFGQLEFYVTDEIDSVVGEYVIVGAARGATPSFSSDGLVVVASDTGEAAAKAIVFHAMELRTQPRTELVLNDANCDRRAFEELSRVNKWLTLGFTQIPSTDGREVVLCGPREWTESVQRSNALSGASSLLTISPDAPTDWFVSQ